MPIVLFITLILHKAAKIFSKSFHEFLEFIYLRVVISHTSIGLFLPVIVNQVVLYLSGMRKGLGIFWRGKHGVG